MSASLLYELTDPWGGRRFYPPGEHPASSRWREELARLEAFRERSLDTPELLAAIAHVEAWLAAFEAGEERAKRVALMALGVPDAAIDIEREGR